MACCALTLCRPIDARADAPAAALVVTRAPGAEDCPDAVAVLDRVGAMGQDAPFEPRPGALPDTWVQVEFSRALSEYEAVITVRGQRNGTRSIHDVGPGCASLGNAVAITLVMLLDPEFAPQEAPPAPLAAKPPASVDSAPAPPPSPSLRFGAEVAGGASLGLLSQAAPFAEAGATLRIERLGFALGAGFVLPDRVTHASGSVELGLWYVYARVSAGIFQHAGTRLFLFAGPSAGSLRGSGVDYMLNSEQQFGWIAGVLGAELRAALSPSFSWTLRLFALAPLLHSEFYVLDADSRQPVFETPSIGAGLAMGIVVEP